MPIQHISPGRHRTLLSRGNRRIGAIHLCGPVAFGKAAKERTPEGEGNLRVRRRLLPKSRPNFVRFFYLVRNAALLLLPEAESFPLAPFGSEAGDRIGLLGRRVSPIRAVAGRIRKIRSAVSRLRRSVEYAPDSRLPRHTGVAFHAKILRKRGLPDGL